MPSRKRVSGFPGMDERRAIMKELQDLGQDSSGQFQAYAQALRSLDAMMERYSKLDTHGLAPALKEKDRTELLDAIRKTAMAGEAYLAAAENSNMDLRQGAPALAEELQGLLSLDYNVLNQYKPEFQRSLPELQDDARTLTVDLRGVELDTVGGKQSMRIPMTVLDADGSRREGFFTEKTEVDIKSTLQSVLDFAKEACDDQGKAQLDAFLTKYMAYLEKERPFEKDEKNDSRDPSKDESLAIDYLAWQVPKQKDFKAGYAKNLLNSIGLDSSKLSKNALIRLDNGLQDLRDDTFNSINIHTLDLRDGDRIDTRSGAMSSVAELLGVPGLTAKSVPIRCINEKGEIIEGSFMERAKGYDLESSKDTTCKNYARVDDNPYRQGSNLVKDLADMQVLDYLCGNVDRHPSNMLYEVDEDGKIVGVQGIDNDSSFGRFHGVKNKRLQLAGLEEMGVMSESMADRIEHMTPAMLKLALRGRGLDKGQLQSACKRLEDLQEKIKTANRIPDTNNPSPKLNRKKLNILKDEEMKSVHFGVLSDRFKKSLFHMVGEAVDKAKGYARNNGYNRKYFARHPEEFENKPLGHEVVTSDRKYTAAGMADALGGAARMYENEATGFEIKDYTGYWTRSSGEFRDMVRAASAAAKLQKRLAQTFSKAVDRQKLLRDDQAVATEKKLSDDAMQTLEIQTKKYLDRKMAQRRVNNPEDLLAHAKGAYEKKRIQYALDMRDVVNAYKRLDDPEAETEAQEKKDVQTRLQTREKRQEAKQPGQEINVG